MRRYVQIHKYICIYIYIEREREICARVAFAGRYTCTEVHMIEYSPDVHTYA